MKILQIIILISFTLSSWASISIVSDLDDTIKITNSGEGVGGAVNGVFTDIYFTGMEQFLKGAEAYSNGLHVLSSSPIILKNKIEKSFAKRGIKLASLTLRKNYISEDKFEYKVRKIKKILENSSDDFIFIGDDVGQDPEAYLEIQKLYPERVLGIYIHLIKNRPVGEVTTYWTTFDLALREYLAGRMLEADTLAVLDELLSEKSLKRIFPKFAYCPQVTTIWAWQVATIYSEASRKLTSKLVQHCQARQSGNFVQE